MSERSDPALPLFLYDGDCGFCRRWATWLSRRAAPAVRFEPFQALGGHDLYGLTVDQLRSASYLVDETGAAHGGSDGFAEALKRSRRLWPVVGFVIGAPGFRGLARWAYDAITRNRHRLPAPRAGG